MKIIVNRRRKVAKPEQVSMRILLEQFDEELGAHLYHRIYRIGRICRIHLEPPVILQILSKRL